MVEPKVIDISNSDEVIPALHAVFVAMAYDGLELSQETKIYFEHVLYGLKNQIILRNTQ